MVEGSSIGFFGSSRGLRLGDHLSPFLFITFFSWGRGEKKAVRRNGVAGGVGRGWVCCDNIPILQLLMQVPISHPQFTDYSQVFYQQDSYSKHQGFVLRCFQHYVYLAVLMAFC